MKNFIESSINEILKASNSDRLVTVVGSGVSANSDVPTWKEMITDMAKDLDISFEDLSTENYLKIAQYYYNERGKKDYYDKISSFFDQNLKPNILHYLLLLLNPYHIITTNFETLIEDSAKLIDKPYDIISENNDIPYAKYSKLIVKMHGNLSSRNIVFNENDYLNYSQNFVLIENYIKSIIASKVLLLVGYSASDPDFKLIFQWVKNILGNNFQNAYFLSVGNEFNRLDFDYYKERGINILYYESLPNFEQIVIDKRNYNQVDFKKFLPVNDSKGLKLRNFLSYILTFEKSKSWIHRIHNIIESYRSINFIHPSYLNNILFGIYVHNNSVSIVDEDIQSELKRVIEDKKYRKIFINSNKNKLRGIIDFLKSNGIKSVRSIDGNFDIIFKTQPRSNQLDNNLIDAFLNFDYAKIMKGVFSFNDSAINVEAAKSYVLAVYFLQKIGKYYESYILCKRLSSIFYEQQNHIYYYLMEANKKRIALLILSQYSNPSFNSIIEPIKQEANEINLEKLLSQLNIPSTIKNTLKSIEDFGFVKDEIHQINTSLDKIIECYKTTLDGGINIHSELDSLNIRAFLVWETLIKNGLISDQFATVEEVYYKYAKAIIYSYATSKLSGGGRSAFSFSKSTSLTQLDIHQIIFLIYNVSTDSLYRLANEVDISKIQLKTNASSILINSFQNFINMLENPTTKIFTIFSNFGLVFSLLELSEAENKKIINEALKTNAIFTIYPPKVYFAIYLSEQIRNNIIEQTSQLKRILLGYLNDIGVNSRLLEFDAMRKSNVIYETANKLNKTDKHTLNNEIYKEVSNKIELFFNSVEKVDYYVFLDFLDFVTFPIYNQLYKKNQKEIDILAKNSLTKLMNINSQLYLEVILRLIHFNILRMTKRLLKTILEIIGQIVKNEENQKRIPSPIERSLHTLAYLIINGKIVVHDIEEKYIALFSNRSRLIQYLVKHPNNTKEEIDINWLDNISSKHLKKWFIDEFNKEVLIEKVIVSGMPHWKQLQIIKNINEA